MVFTGLGAIASMAGSDPAANAPHTKPGGARTSLQALSTAAEQERSGVAAGQRNRFPAITDLVTDR